MNLTLNLKRSKSLIIAIAGILQMVLLCGCDSNISLSPGEIIAKAIDAGKNPTSHYFEGYINYYEKNKLKETSRIKEWYDSALDSYRYDSSSKEDSVITVNSPKRLILYLKKQKKVFIYPEKNSKFSSSAIRTNSFQDIISDLSKNYNIVSQQEEKWNDFNTIHIKAVSKNPKGIFSGNCELWIDKKTWIVVKNISVSPDSRIEQAYTKINLNPKIASTLFHPRFPKGTKIEENSKDELTKSNTSSLKEISFSNKKPVLYHADTPFIKLSSITKLSYTFDKCPRAEYTEDYKKGNTVVYSLSFFKSEPGSSNNQSDLFDRKINIRGTIGYYMDGTTKLISWAEKGINYTLSVNDPSISIEDIKKYMNSMIYTN